MVGDVVLLSCLLTQLADDSDDPDWKPSAAEARSPDASSSTKAGSGSETDEIDRKFERARKEWDDRQQERRRRDAEARARRFQRPPGPQPGPSYSRPHPPGPQAGPSHSRPQPRPVPTNQARGRPTTRTTTNQARARPTWIDPTARPQDDLEDATALLKPRMLPVWDDFVRYIVERFPHPDASRRVSLATVQGWGTQAQQYRHLLLVSPWYLGDGRRAANGPHRRCITLTAIAQSRKMRISLPLQRL
ncbi:hypothetical protein C8F01DRAFT_1188535 [Mycena amicta]|nr:hypothetical protein C8F01DRAFT_1188535 [Mycena amicta]